MSHSAFCLGLHWMNEHEWSSRNFFFFFFPEFLLLSGGKKLKNVSKLVAMWFTIVKWREGISLQSGQSGFSGSFLLSWIWPSPEFRMLGKTGSISLWFDFDTEKRWGDDDYWRLLTGMLSYLPLSILTCNHSQFKNTSSWGCCTFLFLLPCTTCFLLAWSPRILSFSSVSLQTGFFPAVFGSLDVVIPELLYTIQYHCCLSHKLCHLKKA